MNSSFYKELSNVWELLINMNRAIEFDASEGQEEAHNFRLQVEMGNEYITKEDKDRFYELSGRKLNDVKMRRVLYDELSEAFSNALKSSLSIIDT